MRRAAHCRRLKPIRKFIDEITLIIIIKKVKGKTQVCPGLVPSSALCRHARRNPYGHPLYRDRRWGGEANKTSRNTCFSITIRASTRVTGKLSRPTHVGLKICVAREVTPISCRGAVRGGGDGGEGGSALCARRRVDVNAGWKAPVFHGAWYSQNLRLASCTPCFSSHDDEKHGRFVNISNRSAELDEVRAEERRRRGSKGVSQKGGEEGRAERDNGEVGKIKRDADG